MNQSKLDVVKQEIARVNIDILGISELKWTGMVNLIQMTSISTAMDKNPMEKNGVDLTSRKSPKGIWVCLVVRVGKRSPKWWWLKDKETEKPLNMEQKKIHKPE